MKVELMSSSIRSFVIGLFFVYVHWLMLVLGFAEDRRNILFIIVDDLRPALGCYGDSIAKTPNIDRLAMGGRLFDGAYCMQAVCGPSRTAMLTGRLPDNTRVWHNRNRFRDSDSGLITLPQHLKENGYHTVSLGKVFSGDQEELDPISWTEPEILKQRGWKNAVESKQADGKGFAWESSDVADDVYPDGKLAGLAIEKLNALGVSDKPFMLAVGFFKPHLPFNAPKKYWDLIDLNMLRDTENQHMSLVIDAPEEAYHTHRELGGYRGIPRDEKIDGPMATTLRHGYYACVAYVDAQIGRLLDALDANGLSKSTMVVLCGDHGFALGEQKRWCKGTNFECDTRVPLIIRMPGLAQAGVKSTALVELVDLYPTIVQWVGGDQPANLDGQSLMPILLDPSADGRDAVLSQFARPFKPNEPKVMGYSLRTASHRYTRWIDWTDRAVVAEEFYEYPGAEEVRRRDATWFARMNLEHRNLVYDEDQHERVQHLRKRLDQMLEVRVRRGNSTIGEDR
jgi:iduronate 2-sulfatase